MPTPLDPELYARAKAEAGRRFKVPSALKSAWMVKRYKELGGRYEGRRGSGGLDRWFRERWVDVTRRSRHGFERCGRSRPSGPYPVCRPSRRVSSATPKTVRELSRRSLERAKGQKRRKPSRRVSFA